ncbi:MAG: type II toxin-antitoxin system RelE/ParE family toxin [Bacteroidia bacterium]
MSFTVLVSEKAEDQATAAFEYLEAQRQGLGRRFIDDFYSILDQIEANPKTFQKIKGETRRAIIRPFSYSVFFQIRQPEIILVAEILHHAANSDRWP